MQIATLRFMHQTVALYIVLCCYMYSSALGWGRGGRSPTSAHARGQTKNKK